MAALAALFLLASVVGVLGFPNGPPLGQCPQMIPSGHGPSNAVGPPPYNITTSELNYTVGSTLNGKLFQQKFTFRRVIIEHKEVSVGIT